MVLKQLGVIKNNTKEAVLKSDETGLVMNGSSDSVFDQLHKTDKETTEIIIHDDMTDVMEGIEEYSHLVVLYWGHMVSEKSRSIKKVHPMGNKKNKIQGVFSTYSPVRPNPVLITVVRLLKKRGNVLEVVGMDAIDESPVIDIKPYVKEVFCFDDVSVPDWMSDCIKKYNSYD